MSSKLRNWARTTGGLLTTVGVWLLLSVIVTFVVAFAVWTANGRTIHEAIASGETTFLAWPILVGAFAELLFDPPHPLVAAVILTFLVMGVVSILLSSLVPDVFGETLAIRANLGITGALLALSMWAVVSRWFKSLPRTVKEADT